MSRSREFAHLELLFGSKHFCFPFVFCVGGSFADGNRAVCGGVDRTPNPNIGVRGNIDEARLIGQPLGHAENREAGLLVHAVALVLLDDVADRHILLDAVQGIGLDVLGLLRMAEANRAANLPVLDFGLVHDTHLVAPMGILDDEAVAHPRVVNLALLVAEDFQALHPLAAFGVGHVARVGGLRGDGATHDALRLLVLALADLAGFNRPINRAEEAVLLERVFPVAERRETVPTCRLFRHCLSPFPWCRVLLFALWSKVPPPP